MQKFPDIPNKDLVHFGYRAEPFFTSAVIAGGFTNRKNLKKYFGLNNPVNMMLVNFELFNIQPTVDAFAKELTKKIHTAGKPYIDRIVKGCLTAGNSLLKISGTIGKKSLKDDITDKELAKLLEAYYAAAQDYCIYYTIAWFEKPERELAEALAKKYAGSEHEYQRLLHAITSPSRLTAAEREQDDFLKLCSGPTTHMEKKAEAHAKKHGWLSVRYLIGEAWTGEDILSRIRSANKKKSAELLKLQLHHRKDIAAELRKWYRKMSRKDRGLAEQIRDVIFLRTQRADFYQESGAMLQPLVKRIANRLGVPYRDLLNFSPEEVLLALKGRFNMHEHIAPRRELVVTYHNTVNLILEGKAARDYVAKRPVLQRVIKPGKLLSGTTGFPGKITGTVKVIMSNEDVGKVKKGDILVATMTTPNFIAAMERAAAFVTNEGGILCHAAIVSREMKKPCVIGTKNATKILKDGDVIEVDANRGIVKRVKG